MREKTDSEIEQWVLRELNLSEKFGSREVCVLARDGVVRLRGSAQSYQDKLAVAKATRRATGVVSVVNEIKVKPCPALIKRVSASVPPTEAFSPNLLVHHSATPHAVATDGISLLG